MNQFSPESLLRVLAFLAVAFFCGFVPLIFAAVAMYAGRKHGDTASQVARAIRLKAAALRPGMGLTRLQGKIAPLQNPLDGPPESGLAYLRLQVEEYVSAYTSTGQKTGKTPGWKPFADKWRGVPFQVEDDSGRVWVDPQGLDRHFVGEGFTPNDDQIQAACTLLDMSPDMLRGKLRFRMWELRAGDIVTVVGAPIQDAQGNLVIAKAQGQPLFVSRWLGNALDEKLAGQTKQAKNWVLFLGIPGLLFLLCGLCGALTSLLALFRQGGG